MDDNKRLAEEVLEAVGGKENILALQHCMTRIRFNLKDDQIPDREAIKKIPGVLGVIVSGGQFQVVVGQIVPKVYAALCEIIGMKAEENEPKEDGSKKKLSLKKIGSNIMNYVAGSMTPLIPVIVAAGLFRSVQVLIGPAMFNIINEESDLYLFFDIMYNAFFYFLPIYLGYTAAKKLGATPALGMFTAAMLLVPNFTALIESGETFSVYGIPAKVNDYGQSILPILLSAWVLSYVEKFFKKIIPDAFSALFAPFFTMVIMAPITFCALAPLGFTVGDYLGNALVAVGDYGGFIAVAIVAAIYEYLVMTGMHGFLILFAFTIMMQNGSESFVLTAAGCATWAVFGMAVGAVLRLKDKKEKSLAVGALVSGMIGGVVEPALYGIGVKYKKPFIAMTVGGFFGGLYAGLTHVGVYVKASSNFLVVLGFVGNKTSNLVNGLISCLIAFIVAAMITYMFGFSKNDPALQKNN